MPYTDIGNGGKIYDSGEKNRLLDALNQQDLIFTGVENTTGKNKNATRYAIIAGGAILLLAVLFVVVKRRK